MYFRNFVIISTWNGRGPSFAQTWIPFTQGCFAPSLVETGSVVLEKKMKMWKVYNDDNDSDGQILIRKAHLSLLQRWAKKFTTTPTTKTDNGQILIRKAHLILRLRWAKKGTNKNIPRNYISILYVRACKFSEITLPPSNFKLDLHSTGKNSALWESFSMRQKCLAFIWDTFSLNLDRQKQYGNQSSPIFM